MAKHILEIHTIKIAVSLQCTRKIASEYIISKQKVNTQQLKMP